MTQDEIIEMAIRGHAGTRDAICWAINQVVKAEREACANVCEDSVEYAGDELARQIRARGEKS
jgi:hypothetical protein